MFDDLIDELFDGLFGALVPDHPAVLYGLPTALLGGGFALVAEPRPYLSLVAGVVLSVSLVVASNRSDLGQESSDGRSRADWGVVTVFVLVVGGIVVVGEVDAVRVGVSTTHVLGVVTGLFAGAAIVEWLLPAIRARP